MISEAGRMKWGMIKHAEAGIALNKIRESFFEFFYSRVDTTSLNSILDIRKAPQT